DRNSALHPFPTRRSSDLPLGLGVWMPGGHPRPGTPPPDRAFLALAVTESCGTQSCDNRRDDLRRRFPATPGAHSGTFPCLRLGRSEEHTSELQSRENLVC